MCWKAIALATLILPLLDAPYLYLNKDKYQSVNKAISGRGFTTRYYSALLVYIALGIGVAILAIPNIRTSSWETLVLDSLKWGGVVGLVSYATFDFTIHFMFQDWKLQLAIMDTIWGSILCALTSGIVALLLK